MKKKLEEVASHCGIEEAALERFIAFAWVRPATEELILDEEDIARAQLIHELQHELGVNDEAVPIILDLVDQLHRMHWELRRGA